MIYEKKRSFNGIWHINSRTTNHCNQCSLKFFTCSKNCSLVILNFPFLRLFLLGFKDLLHIGNQCRPNLFDLSITLPEKLYDSVIEVDERLYLDQQKCQLDLTQEFKDLVEM